MQDRLPEVVLILVGSTLIILVLTSLIITALFINQKRKFRHNLEMTGLKNEYDSELLRAQLEIQSQTFETISRELHDNVGTLISIALVHLRALSDSSQVQVSDKLPEVHTLLNEAMDILRDVSKSLNPENINSLGWQQSFLSELDRIGRSNVFSIKSSVEGEPFPIETSSQIILFRILQEAINNVVKHSGATEMCTRIVFSGNKLNIAIKDNGKGMDNGPDLPTSGGSGIKNMRARAAMLPAILDITSGPETGTSVNISYLKNK